LIKGAIIDMIQTEGSSPPELHSSLFQPVSAPAAAGSLNGVPAGQDVPAEPIELVIRPRSGWIGIDWKEIYAYRELLWFLIWRDVSVRYKQTILGSAWAIIQPLIWMLIFSFTFGRIVKVPMPAGIPYPVFVFAGLIPWMLFSQGFAQAAVSLANQQQLLTKVYFPRVFVPTAAAAVYLVDLFISLGLYGLILIYYRVVPSWTIVLLPVLIALTLIATLSLGLTLSAFTVFYRDFRHVIPFLTQVLMFVTPVIYPLNSVIKQPLYRGILSLNPLFGIVPAYRSAILGDGIPWDFPCLAISTTVAVVGFLFGIFYFRRTERRFADFI
jgi:lipopolysaccharide transport system permease protein